MKKKITALILFAFLIDSFEPVLAFSLTDNNSKTYARSESEVVEKYNEMINDTNNNYALYEINPDLDNNIEGVLSEDVQKETLKQINYYRWQYGVGSVSLKSENNYRNQRCTIALSYINKLTHKPKSEYGYLLTGFSDEFVNDAEEGCSGGVGYSGNASKGGSLISSIKEYISEKNNINVGAGHRYSILDPGAYAVSMGYYNKYGAVSVYSNNTFDYDYYSWPASGYNPSDIFTLDDSWSIKFNGAKYSITSNTKVTLEINNEVFPVNYIVNEHYNALSFNIPSNVQKKLTNYKGVYANGSKVTVNVTSLKGLASELKYTVIFTTKEDLTEDIELWYKKENIPSFGRSSTLIDNQKYYVFDGNYNYDIKITTSNMKNTNFDITVKDQDIAYYDNTNKKIIFFTNGLTSLNVKDANTNKEFSINIKSTNIDKVKENTNYQDEEKLQNNNQSVITYVFNNSSINDSININEKDNNVDIIIGDLNNDKKVDESDIKLLLLKIYSDDNNMDIDLNHDGKIDINDVIYLKNIIK